jgi:hypothetical protein
MNLIIAITGAVFLFSAFCLAMVTLIKNAPGEASAQSYSPPVYALKGGILLTIDVQGEQFKAFITNPETIRQLNEIRAGTAPEMRLVGRISLGAGESDYNAPYEWHLDPYDIRFVSAVDKDCDGTPSFVEANLKHFLEQVKQYCPSQAVIVKVTDYRPSLPNLLKGSIGSRGAN